MSSSPFETRSKPVMKRTYGSGSRPRTYLPSSPRSTVSFDSSSPARGAVNEKENKSRLPTTLPQKSTTAKASSSASAKRKFSTAQDDSHPTLHPIFSGVSKPSHPNPVRPSKRPKLTKSTPSDAAPLIQMHLALSSKPIVRTCPDCGLSYTVAAPEDELLHKRHHARVTTGIEWTREDGKLKGVEVVESDVSLGKGQVGRVLVVPGDASGRLGSKLSLLLDTINTELSAPALTEAALCASKVFIFVLPSSAAREKIVGCVVAQRIQEALRIMPKGESNALLLDSEGEDGGLFCDPIPVPTPLGISRLWTSSQQRHKGIATILLDTACRRTVYGCQLDPRRGEVAFSQPTNSGRGVMLKWGGGGVRIFTET